MDDLPTTSETRSGRLPAAHGSLHRACSAALVEKLLDAAFHELQHDTGPHNTEYVYQRNNLKAAFKRILRVRQNSEYPEGISG